MVPAPALVRLHQDPEEPMPYVGDTALIAALPAEAIEALLAVAGPGSGSPLEIVELRQVRRRAARATPGPRRGRRRHGAVRAVHRAASRWTPDMAAVKQAHMARGQGRAGAVHAAPATTSTSPRSRSTRRASFDTDTWARLCAVKDRVDPDNVIHANHAI